MPKSPFHETPPLLPPSDTSTCCLSRDFPIPTSSQEALNSPFPPAETHIDFETYKAKLSELLITKLRNLGFIIMEGGQLSIPDADKEAIRRLHISAVEWEIRAHHGWLSRNLPKYLSYFADGAEVVPERIQPVLVEVIPNSMQRVSECEVGGILWGRCPPSAGGGPVLRRWPALIGGGPPL